MIGDGYRYEARGGYVIAFNRDDLPVSAAAPSTILPCVYQLQTAAMTAAGFAAGRETADILMAASTAMHAAVIAAKKQALEPDLLRVLGVDPPQRTGVVEKFRGRRARPTVPPTLVRPDGEPA